ncbi:hypothetical protein [Saccharopolyspora spinosa]|uniref:Uncharacterized protein n=1 Tax=Saccharopolyspora spinosa TaxID=60894 RepID=A0A2N3XTT4_SACSN|nr:hypothetical protein [Saccharopolyspora spinosa]PKW14104.1 hypothetical protein A8926_1689 [Saccharopolyspora spinosa]
MERDPVNSLLPELAEWAENQEQPVHGNSHDAEILLRLLYEHAGLADLAELRPADLDELLLELFPVQVAVEPGEDLAEVIATLHDLLSFAGDTGRMTAEQLDGLRRKVDEIAPRFAETAMDPENWGGARVLEQALMAEGVDPTDEAAVARWVGEAAESLGEAQPYDLREELGLPDRLPPLRLPSDEELAAAARQSPLLDRARRLALRTVACPIKAGELRVGDTVDVAEELGFPVPDAVEGMADIPELAKLWEWAAELEFIGPGTEVVEFGPTFEDWPDGDDEAVLDVWADALGLLLEEIFQDECSELDLDDVAFYAMVSLFLARSEGASVAELRDVIREIAVDESTSDGAWGSWVQRCGDPAERLLATLVDLGAAQVDEGVARLTPLGQYTFGGALTDGGVEVPLLPPVEEMGAFDLVDFAKGATDEELAAETEAWFAVRGPVAATDDLLTAAAEGEAEDRMIAVSIAAPLAETATQRWQQALDEPMLRPYAKVMLHQLDPSGELESTVTDAARLLTDMLAAALDSVDIDELPELLAEMVPAGQEPTIFEEMWRLDHPAVRDVLMLIGDQHPDKKIAKAARKTSFKIPPAE